MTTGLSPQEVQKPGQPLGADRSPPFPDSTNAREILSDGAHEIEGENIIIILIMTAKTKCMFTSVMVSF